MSNFGFSDLTILDVTSSPGDFGTFFTELFSIPPLRFVELTVTFSPTETGHHSEPIEVNANVPPPARSRLVVPVSEEGIP